MNLTAAYIFRTLVFFTILLTSSVRATAGYFENGRNGKKGIAADTTRYPLRDRPGDPYTYPYNNPFDLRDTSFVKRNIEYDPRTKQYYIVEKIGNRYYRTPVSFSMEEFVKLQGEKDEKEYFKKRSALLANMNRRLFKPKFKVSNDWFNRIMGVGPDGKVKIDIRPTGYVEMLQF